MHAEEDQGAVDIELDLFFPAVAATAKVDNVSW